MSSVRSDSRSGLSPGFSSDGKERALDEEMRTPTRPRIVTTSWDDGGPKDVRVAEILRAAGIRGTFYIPIIGDDGRPTFDPASLKTLDCEGFEVGAHGLSHHTLPKFRGKELSREVTLPKRILEDTIGHEVRMIAYPEGRYSANVIREVKRAGYRGARTTEMLGYRLNFRPFAMSTTLHAYPHTGTSYLRNCTRALNFRRGFEWIARFHRAHNWVELGKRFFDLVLEKGGVWHLYGHSRMIQEQNLWDDLEELLSYVAGRTGVVYLLNHQVLDFLSARKPVLTGEHPNHSSDDPLYRSAR